MASRDYGEHQAPDTVIIPADDTISFRDSVAGNTSLLSANRTGIVFTYTVHNYDPSKGATTREIVVGFGIRSVTIDQTFNVSQEGSIGYMDIETVTHGVASNTLSVSKMLLRGRQLSKIGLSGYGISVMSAPMLNARILDISYAHKPLVSENQPDTTIVCLDGLHLQGNRMTISHGQTVGEDVTFRFNRAYPYDGKQFSVDHTNYHAMLEGYFKAHFGQVYLANNQVEVQDAFRNSNVDIHRDLPPARPK